MMKVKPDRSFFLNLGALEEAISASGSNDLEMWSCMRHVNLKVLPMGDAIYRRRPVHDGDGVALPLGVSN